MAWKEWVRTIEIEPSLYAADFLRLGEQIDHLLGAGARVFHFDIGDGHFVEPVTIGPIVLQAIAPLIHRFDGVIDCHLMVENPEHHFEMVKRAGGDSVTFHVEACEEPWKAIKLARDLDLGVGVAFNPETSVEDAVGASIGADLVLCMSIHPGYSGQRFMPESVERIAKLRSELHPNLFVQVDGGVSEENLVQVRQAGAQLAVAGNSIFRTEDYPRGYRRLVKVFAEAV
ncbi:MAG TPA: ribulose-phosphate 3-epimerase [Gaiellaceae bacterium]|jgi:ribulose-phosphate 3-epimerase|nr:ribulose-phosphate 3-epimerase [Gaiellaceae bacterium]